MPEPESAITDDNGQANAEPEETRPLSPQFAALAKQRRALQVKERELAEREKAMTGQAQPGLDMAQLKANPLSVLEQAGVTYDQLTEAILANQNGITPEIVALKNELKAEIKAIKDGVDGQNTQAEKQVLAEMQREATRLASAGDEYEMVRETRSIPDVMKLIERTYREQGEVLDVAEAMQLVEDELIKESMRIAQIKKVQSRLAPPPPPPQPQNNQRPTRTLTNRDTSRAVMSAKARAVAAFNGTLNK
jgi:hypothetical protein